MHRNVLDRDKAQPDDAAAGSEGWIESAVRQKAGQHYETVDPNRTNARSENAFVRQETDREAMRGLQARKIDHSLSGCAEVWIEHTSRVESRNQEILPVPGPTD